MRTSSGPTCRFVCHQYNRNGRTHSAKRSRLKCSSAATESLPQAIRKMLGSTYEQFQRSQWREGFEDACQALERESRKYLKSGMKSGRIKIVTKKGPVTLTAKQVDKLTMGQLADKYAAIQPQNHADGLIGQALKTLNSDRVGVVHHKTKKITEKRLRANVGGHVWTIVATLKLM